MEVTFGGVETVNRTVEVDATNVLPRDPYVHGETFVSISRADWTDQLVAGVGTDAGVVFTAEQFFIPPDLSSSYVFDVSIYTEPWLLPEDPPNQMNGLYVNGPTFELTTPDP